MKTLRKSKLYSHGELNSEELPSQPCPLSACCDSEQRARKPVARLLALGKCGEINGDGLSCVC